MKDKYDPKWVE